MTKQEMFKLGAEHAKAGKQLTPFDCQAIDKELFAAMKSQPDVTSQARYYSAMRGAFNRGWNKEYARLVLGDGLCAMAEAS